MEDIQGDEEYFLKEFHRQRSFSGGKLEEGKGKPVDWGARTIEFFRKKKLIHSESLGREVEKGESKGGTATQEVISLRP